MSFSTAVWLVRNLPPDIYMTCMRLCLRNSFVVPRSTGSVCRSKNSLPVHDDVVLEIPTGACRSTTIPVPFYLHLCCDFAILHRPTFLLRHNDKKDTNRVFRSVCRLGLWSGIFLSLLLSPKSPNRRIESNRIIAARSPDKGAFLRLIDSPLDLDQSEKHKTYNHLHQLSSFLLLSLLFRLLFHPCFAASTR